MYCCLTSMPRACWPEKWLSITFRTPSSPWWSSSSRPRSITNLRVAGARRIPFTYVVTVLGSHSSPFVLQWCTINSHMKWRSRRFASMSESHLFDAFSITRIVIRSYWVLSGTWSVPSSSIIDSTWWYCEGLPRMRCWMNCANSLTTVSFLFFVP